MDPTKELPDWWPYDQAPEWGDEAQRWIGHVWEVRDDCVVVDIEPDPSSFRRLESIERAEVGEARNGGKVAMWEGTGGRRKVVVVPSPVSDDLLAELHRVDQGFDHIDNLQAGLELWRRFAYDLLGLKRGDASAEDDVDDHSLRVWLSERFDRISSDKTRQYMARRRLMRRLRSMADDIERETAGEDE